MRYLQSIVQPNTDLVASADITPFDLPVNPLSFLLLRLELTRTDPTAVDVYNAIDGAITQITNIRVQHKGEDIIQGSLRDLMVLNMVQQRAFPGWASMIQTNDSLSSLVFPLCLGRRMYDPKSCFPATSRGNLRFFMTAGADDAGYDDINFSLEAVELIEATPEEYLKYTTNARASVAGQFDMVLPINNPYLGILLFDTGLAEASDQVLGWGTVKLLKDNVEQYFPLSDYEVLAGMLHAQMGHVPGWPGHSHFHDVSAAADFLQDDSSYRANERFQGYAFLDFDPLKDGSYQLETAGAADLKLRGNGDAVEDIRALPIERVMVRR